MLGLPLSRVAEVVCANYEIELTELGRRGNPHPARAALAYLARRRTAATNAVAAPPGDWCPAPVIQERGREAGGRRSGRLNCSTRPSEFTRGYGRGAKERLAP